MSTPGAQVAFYRTLYSQSAASVTAGCVAAAVAEDGVEVRQTLLVKGAHDNARRLLRERPGDGAVLYFKPNFQDVGQSVAMLEPLRRDGAYSGLYLFGVYATLNARALMERFPHVDGVLVGEPETAAAALHRCLGEGGSPTSVTGLIHRDADGALVDTGPAPVPSLDHYVWPRRDVERTERASLANLEASRGCIAACTFCHIPVFEASSAAPRRRVRPVEDVVDEMVYLHHDLGKQYLVFNDGLFWSGPRDDARLAEFVAALRAHPRWSGEFMVYLRTNPMPGPQQLRDLASVGLVRVFIGVESEDEATLKVYRKGARADAYSTVKAALAEVGVSHHIGFLMFHPFVRLEQVRRDVRFLDRHDQLHRIGVMIEPARLVPGTALKQQAIAAGLVDTPDPDTVDQAYSYRFSDPRVSFALRELRRGIQDALGGRHRALEYFHTSSELLEYVLLRRVGDDPVCRRPDGLLALRSELRRLLADYLGRLFDIAAEHEPDTGAAARLNAEAGPALRGLASRTEAEHALWFAAVADSGHGDLVGALFTSEEGA